MARYSSCSTKADLEKISCKPKLTTYYGGLHGEAFAKRKEWLAHGAWPGTAAWWVGDDQPVTWEEAHRRYELLHHRGSSPDAFNFKQAFSPDGAPYTVDRNAVKKIALENQVRVQGAGDKGLERR